MSTRTPSRAETRVVHTTVPRDHVVEAAHSEDVSATRRSFSKVWTPAQWISGIAGLFYVVLAGVTLLRTGVEDLSESAAVGPFEATGAFALFALFIGLILMAAASNARTIRGTSITMGVIMIAAGMIALIEPGSLSTWLGNAASLGALVASIGVVVLGTALISPLIYSHSERVIDHTSRNSENFSV